MTLKVIFKLLPLLLSQANSLIYLHFAGLHIFYNCSIDSPQFIAIQQTKSLI